MFDGIRTTEDDLFHAMDHIDEEEYGSALGILARVVSFDPANAFAYELWTMCHVRLGMFERAVQIADAGLSRGLSPVALHVQRSSALLELNRLDEAREGALSAMAADPESSAAVRMLAAVEMACGSHDAALRAYEEFLQRQPEDEPANFALVELASKLERVELVIRYAREYLRRFDKDPEVLSALGQAYVDTNDLRRADRAFRDAAQMEPDEVDHHLNVLMLALYRGNDKEFDSYVDRLHSHDPELAEAVLNEVESLISRTAENDESSES